jgi:hypothetical protein
MSKYRPRCSCTSILLPDGTCRHRCDPKLRKPGARAARLQSVLRKRESHVGSPTELIGREQAAVAFEKAVPVLSRYRDCASFVDHRTQRRTR